MTFLPNNTAAVGHGRGCIPAELRGVRIPKRDELKARIARFLYMPPNDDLVPADKFDVLLISVMKFIQLTGDFNRLKWLLEQIMPEDQRNDGDIETFKTDYLRFLDRKKLVALVKEGQEQKTNEDV